MHDFPSIFWPKKVADAKNHFSTSIYCTFIPIPYKLAFPHIAPSRSFPEIDGGSFTFSLLFGRGNTVRNEGVFVWKLSRKDDEMFVGKRRERRCRSRFFSLFPPPFFPPPPSRFRHRVEKRPMRKMGCAHLHLPNKNYLNLTFILITLFFHQYVAMFIKCLVC